MSEMLLLGAGASIEAGIPGAYEMTKKIALMLEKKPWPGISYDSHENNRKSHVINFVIGGLLFEEAKKGKNPFTTGINVEDVFNAMQLLAERDSLEASPFIGSWDSTVRKLDSDSVSLSTLGDVFNKFSENYFREIRKLIEPAIQYGSGIYGSPHNINIQDELRKLHQELQAKPGEGKIFRATANDMILALKELVWLKDQKQVLHLAPILNLLRTQGRLVISTFVLDKTI